MIRYIQIPAFCAATGYTAKAVRRKIESGVWLQDQVWIKAPDGHILIDCEGYNRWAEGQTKQGSKNEATRSGSASTGEAAAAGRLFALSRPPQT